MIDLPPLPPIRQPISGGGGGGGNGDLQPGSTVLTYIVGSGEPQYTSAEMRSYGEACAIAEREKQKTFYRRVLDQERAAYIALRDLYERETGRMLPREESRD